MCDEKNFDTELSYELEDYYCPYCEPKCPCCGRKMIRRSYPYIPWNPYPWSKPQITWTY